VQGACEEYVCHMEHLERAFYFAGKYRKIPHLLVGEDRF
jgi:hypothetical protein